MESTGRFTADLRRLMGRSYDVCQSCGSHLQRDVAAYAGYAADGSPLYVGVCCEALIAELATHVYWWWEVDKRCNPNTVLWRYIDFAKFVALLEQRAVYFCRADLLGDRFEGAAGIREHWPKWEASYLDFFRKAVATVPAQLKPPPPEQIEQEAARLFADFNTIFNTISDRDRRRTFASCWHSNTVESEALWRLYCPPPTAGVAIRTDVEALGISLGEDPQIRIGQVQYVDFRKGFAGLHDRIFWKRKSLSHEAEVRAVIQKFDAQQEPGLRVLADLPRLLHAVVPSPFAPTWFAEIVEATMQRFDVSAPIVRSELLSEPFF